MELFITNTFKVKINFTLARNDDSTKRNNYTNMLNLIKNKLNSLKQMRMNISPSNEYFLNTLPFHLRKHQLTGCNVRVMTSCPSTGNITPVGNGNQHTMEGAQESDPCLD